LDSARILAAGRVQRQADGTFQFVCICSEGSVKRRDGILALSVMGNTKTRCAEFGPRQTPVDFPRYSCVFRVVLPVFQVYTNGTIGLVARGHRAAPEVVGLSDEFDAELRKWGLLDPVPSASHESGGRFMFVFI
jgi:hypothetical protein